MDNNKRNIYSFLSGGTVATFGGLIGLGGAEFRLPILVGFFGFAAYIGVFGQQCRSSTGHFCNEIF